MEIMESVFTPSTVLVQTNLRKYRENIEKATEELCPSKHLLGVLEDWTLMPSILGSQASWLDTWLNRYRYLPLRLNTKCPSLDLTGWKERIGS